MNTDAGNIDFTAILNSLSKPQPYVDYNFAADHYRIQRAVDEANRERREKEQRALNAAETTADNTVQLLSQMNTVTKNQNDYIELLKAILQQQQQQISLLDEQLKKVKAIFASQEDGVSVEKDIMRLIQEQIDDKHPLWEYVKDKGGDLAVSGIVAGVPVIYNAIKSFLVSLGIILP